MGKNAPAVKDRLQGFQQCVEFDKDVNKGWKWQVTG